MSVPKFDARKDLPATFSMAIVGKRCAGKTLFVQDLLWGQTNLAASYDEIIVLNAVRSEYAGLGIDSEQQAIKLFEGIRNGVRPEHSVCIIVDGADPTARSPFRKDLDDIVRNGRHLGISLIITSQYTLPQQWRSNMDAVVSFRTEEQSYLKKLHENYFDRFDSHQEFKALHDQLTSNGGRLIALNNYPSGERGIRWCERISEKDATDVRNAMHKYRTAIESADKADNAAGSKVDALILGNRFS